MARLSTIVLIIITIASLMACGSQKAQRNILLADAARKIGEAYMRQGDYTAALGKLLEAEKLNPEDPIVHHDIGLCYRAKKRTPDAVSHLKRAVKLKPNYSVARNTLGRVYLESGEYDHAIATLKELTKDALYATPHFALANMGEAYFYKHDFSRSTELYQQALKIEPSFIPALHGLGRTYVAMAKGRLALVYLEKALSLSPNVAQIHLDTAEAYEQMGRVRQARALYQTVIDLAGPESDLARKARHRLNTLY